MAQMATASTGPAQFDPFASSTTQNSQDDAHHNNSSNALATTDMPPQHNQWAVAPMPTQPPPVADDSAMIPTTTLPPQNQWAVGPPAPTPAANGGILDFSTISAPNNAPPPGYDALGLAPAPPQQFPPPPPGGIDQNPFDAYSPPPHQGVSGSVGNALDFVDSGGVGDALDFITAEQEPAPAGALDFITTEPEPTPEPPRENQPDTATPSQPPTTTTSSSSRSKQKQMQTYDEAPSAEAIEKRKEQISRALARNAGPDASPLPNTSLIGPVGFILTRISFRTLLLKRWKQSYWAKWGPTSLLLFRSQAQFDDWKNNPYHNQRERDFLIRMKIDFSGDLINIAGCRGYKITSVKRKAYGRRESDMLMHFKLERHMDYGATIAACFASQDADEVEALRKVIVECIKSARSVGSRMIVTAQEDPGVRYNRPTVHAGYDSDTPMRQPSFRGRYDD